MEFTLRGAYRSQSSRLYSSTSVFSTALPDIYRIKRRKSRRYFSTVFTLFSVSDRYRPNFSISLLVIIPDCTVNHAPSRIYFTIIANCIQKKRTTVKKRLCAFEFSQNARLILCLYPQNTIYTLFYTGCRGTYVHKER
mgnify:CR=1 FL=1